MNACLRHCIIAFALMAIPAASLATDNAWPVSPSPSNLFGWNVAGAEGHDAMSDGAGGYYVAWDDGYTAHLQHVLANGRFAWAWYYIQLGLGGLGYANPAIAPDGFGGVLVARETHGGVPTNELLVQRVNSDGTYASGWPEGGVPVSPSADYDYYCDVVADGSGGAFVSFIRTGPYHVFIAHITSLGVLDPAWPADGVEVQKNAQTSSRPQLFADGQGGALVVYVQTGAANLRVARVDRYGNLHPEAFPVDGLLLATGVSPEFGATVDIDGVVTVAWADARTGSREIYTNAVYAYGLTGWAPAGGLQITSTPGIDERVPALATDPASNLLCAWLAGSAIRGTQLQLGLVPHPSFPAGGVVVSPSAGANVQRIALDSDGAGGLLAGWNDPSSPYVIRAQRLTSDGAVAPGWSPAGDSLAANPSGFLGKPYIFRDGDGGIVGVFDANHLLATNRLRRDARHGVLVPAVLVALHDVEYDQGGKLAIYWRASERDTLPSNPVGSYMTWRRMPAIYLQARIASGARLLRDGDSPESVGPGAIRALPGASTTIYWEFLGSTPARGWSGYGMTVSTRSDLLGPAYSIPWEAFMVETVSPSGVVLATSAPDSGYSIDNLSPAQPAAFTAVHAGGATHLHWSRSLESDFGQYRLHRGSSAAFVPDDANLVAAIADTGFVDPAPAGSYYKLAALDVHGNASPYALVTPGQTLDVVEDASWALSFAPIAPNPARGRVSLTFTLPHAGHVRLEVFDTQGRRVRGLVNEARDAGIHTLPWDLHDDGGRALAAGLYLARIETQAGAVARRFVVVE